MTTYTFNANVVYTSRATKSIAGTASTSIDVSLVLQNDANTFGFTQPFADLGIFTADIGSEYLIKIDGEVAPENANSTSSLTLLNMNWRNKFGITNSSQFAILAISNYAHPSHGSVIAEFIIPISGDPLPNLLSTPEVQTFLGSFLSSNKTFPGLTPGSDAPYTALRPEVTQDDLVDLGTSSLNRFNAGIGDDTIVGGRDYVEIFGGYGNDSLLGGTSGDEIYDVSPQNFQQDTALPAGISNNDTIDGGDGSDSIYVSSGRNSVQGGNGYDTFYIGAVTESGQTTIDGGADEDSVNFEYMPRGVIFDLATGMGTIDLNLTSVENVNGSLSSDTIYGDDGNNTILEVGGQNNWLYGRGGDDTLIAEGGQSRMFGGDGTDTAMVGFFELSDLTIVEHEGGLGLFRNHDCSDRRVSNFVADDVEFIEFTSGSMSYADIASRAQGTPLQFTGREFGERIETSWFADQIFAGGGTDWIRPNGGRDTIDGGLGRDMVDFSSIAPAPDAPKTPFFMSVDLAAGTAEVGHDTVELISIERISGTHSADWLRGTDRADHLRGMGHYDWFVATEGADTLDGGSGKDMVSFVEWVATTPDMYHDPLDPTSQLPDTSEFAGVVVDMETPANNTNLAADLELQSIERITGSTRQDLFIGDGQSNDFRGLGGYDWFVGSAGGRERYFGGAGLDTVTYYRSTSGVEANLRNGRMIDGQETGFGSRGDAALDLYFSIENLVGTRFDDRLSGSSAANQLSGLDGDDMLFGYAGRDKLRGGAGNDTIDGGAGVDYAYFEGQSTDYTVTRTDHRAVTVAGADGTDMLRHVEFFVFDDATVDLWTLPII